MSKLLAAVTRAATKRIDTDRQYRQAIENARAAGHTYTEIGRAAGITKQGAAFLLNPDPRKRET